MPPTDKLIEELVTDLACARLASDAFNQYAPVDDDNARRCANLLRYLHTMAARRPANALVMEAPGYRGCRLTGVPVTSRQVLLEGIAPLSMFGMDAGFRNVADAGFERVYREQSATIVWTTLADLRALPLIWNAFPFHPHKSGDPRSNRKPRKPELELGASFLLRVLDMWQIENVIAVGNVAYETLLARGISCRKVRHPAHGGKNDFVAGLEALLSVGA